MTEKCDECKINEKVMTVIERRIKDLENVLYDLMQDTQHLEHNCGDCEHCPVYKARKILEKTNEEYIREEKERKV